MAVNDGNTVKIDYTGTLDDGTVFDSSENHEQPLEFTVGAGQVIKGFEEAVIGMEVDEEKEFRIEAVDAYGDVNPELVQHVPRAQIQIDGEVTPGVILVVKTPEGMELPAKVTGVSDSEIILDMNHPLAGKPLNFKIKVVEISS
ncbi:FKBP-type peptidyl-prolyl cis-trans isomerase 2 [Methanohalophilus levihalophilus]|uniref:FKBP-type peptidyl-prolyl cis-trans isomerase n=1 Tax=Methanohalophilus levihalophilus TaxID=1431282 RepID=UPI001AE69FCD|nr:peptidylprolyl isomerase [Methanohalophilus levihalophilus]MBP2029720.1 FKBP-type peptidyl-prolyl cis-trans isomerase 2 [Methanohalophilus levihalophilus]